MIKEPKKDSGEALITLSGIIEGYDGKIGIEKSESGGAKIEIELNKINKD